MKSKLLIIAGEASGDLHGSELIKEINKLNSEIEIYGIGGDKMISSGMNANFHINQMSFLGFIEIIRHLPFIRKVKRELLTLLKEKNIRNVVLIDYPGFNLSFAKSVNKFGIKAIYYISPQIWAWGRGRIIKIKKYISRMIVLFPFEKKLYSTHQIDSDFVGHPLAKSLREYNFLSKDELFEKYELDSDKGILLLMPGSRKQELDKILEHLLSASEKLVDDYNLQVVVACADNIETEYFEKFKEVYNFKVIKGTTYDLLKHAKFAIIKSGTSTLEAGIIGTPFIVVYKTNILTYWIGRSLIKIKNIALANIVAEEKIVPELIQDEVNPETIYAECSKILSDENELNRLRNKLSVIKDKLYTEGNPSKKAAEIILSELNG